MHRPQSDDYIDIHVHGGTPAPGKFILESLMAHEGKKTTNQAGIAYTYGIHPWFLDETNHKQLLRSVEAEARNPDLIALGEAGFDRLRGPSLDLQRSVFEEQIAIAEELNKPVVIHCVKGWDELMEVKKRLRPRMPWLIHGFRGGIQMANQLLNKGLYLSIWFEFALRTESSSLFKALPKDKFFLETDGADVDIRDIYLKVSVDTGLRIEELKSIIYSNYLHFFGIE
jgi:TatD DNase family protein